MPVNKLLNLPYGSYLMVRLDYVIICGNELEAKIMRIIEMYMDDERKILYREMLNDPKQSIQPETTVEITKDIWVAISHRLFKNDLYDQDMSENTLKRAIKSLVQKNFIRVRDDRSRRYEAPKYQIDTQRVQKELDLLGKLGKTEYQKLMVSKIDGIKNSSRQKVTPADRQNLTPSSNSRVSKIDPNSRRVTDLVDRLVEEDTDASASTPAREEPYVPVFDLPQRQAIQESSPVISSSIKQVDEERIRIAAQPSVPAQGVGYEKPSKQFTSQAASSQPRAKAEPKPLNRAARIDLVFQWLDKVRKEASGDPMASYVANGANKKRLGDLIDACANTPNEVNEANVSLAWLAMWNAGQWRDGKSWQDPGMLTVEAFCKHYGSYLDRARARPMKKNPLKPREKTALEQAREYDKRFAAGGAR